MSASAGNAAFVGSVPNTIAPTPVVGPVANLHRSRTTWSVQVDIDDGV